jgi:hypothetical protein
MNIKKFWMMLAIALVSFCAVCCGGDDDDEPIVNPENPVVYSQEINEYVFPGAGGFNLIYENGGYVRVGWHNNGGGILDNPSLNISSNKGIVIKAVDVGMFSSISDIKKLPKEGWVDYPIFYGVDLHKGYIVEIYKENYFRYYRLFISSFDKSASGDIVGVRVKYQKFDPSN